VSRTPIAFAAPDISVLAKSLRNQLAGRDRLPGHLELLNMLARSTGHRNFQHFRAQSLAQARLDAGAPAEAPVDHRLVERIAGHFDRKGGMLRWPGRTRHQELALWWLWAGFPAGRSLAESEVNAHLKARHLFGDHAILRRSLCDSGLLSRTPDCRVYRRVERQPPPEAAALIRHLKARVAQAPYSERAKKRVPSTGVS
jgi:hypothetical protein